MYSTHKRVHVLEGLDLDIGTDINVERILDLDIDIRRTYRSTRVYLSLSLCVLNIHINMYVHSAFIYGIYTYDSINMCIYICDNMTRYVDINT